MKLSDPLRGPWIARSARFEQVLRLISEMIEIRS
jgi:hypothetical protein